MPTIKSKDIVDELILNNGHYEDDPIVHSIVKYYDINGSTCYGLNYTEVNNYTESPYVRQPKVIFERDK